MGKKYDTPFDAEKYERYMKAKVKARFFPFVIVIGLFTMTFSVVFGFVVLFLSGLSVLILPDSVLQVIASATVGAVGSSLVLVYKFFFDRK